jgi:hypothetical protein
MTSWSTSGVYGYTWDVNYEVMDMEQLRNTYPLSGFRILVAAYAQSLKQIEPLDPEGFVLEYAGQQFGLNPTDAQRFWQTLTLSPELIVEGKPEASTSIADLLTAVNKTREILDALKPVRNEMEFEQFRLMADLRAHYLAFKEVELTYNSEDFTRDNFKQLVPELERLMAESKSLDWRFIVLNRGFLYDSEIQDQNRIRNVKLNALYRRVVGNR